MQFVNLKTLCFHNFYNGTDKMFHFSPNSYKYMKTYCDMITDNWDSYLLDTSSIYITLDTTFDHDTLEFVQSFIVQCIRCNIPHDMKFVDSDNDFWETMLSTISTERCIDVMKVADFMCFMFLYQACIKHFKRAIDEWDVEVICKLFSCTSTTPIDEPDIQSKLCASDAPWLKVTDIDKLKQIYNRFTSLKSKTSPPC